VAAAPCKKPIDHTLLLRWLPWQLDRDPVAIVLLGLCGELSQLVLGHTLLLSFRKWLPWLVLIARMIRLMLALCVFGLGLVLLADFVALSSPLLPTMMVFSSKQAHRNTALSGPTHKHRRSPETCLVTIEKHPSKSPFVADDNGDGVVM
jgi:hypothetical protein